MRQAFVNAMLFTCANDFGAVPRLQKHVDEARSIVEIVESVPVLTACIRTAIYIEVSYQPLATGNDERAPT